MTAYLSLSELQSCLTLYDVFHKLCEREMIKPGHYEILSAVFETMNNIKCLDIVKKYSMQDINQQKAEDPFSDINQPQHMREKEIEPTHSETQGNNFQSNYNC